VIWIETLSRHKEPVHRVRCADDTATIGRGYDNDAVIDDPYVAPSHLRIRRDDEGTLIVEDLGSHNGLYDETGRRQQSLRLTGDTLIRIGQTWLRVRESSFAVAPERKLPPSRRAWPWLLVLVALTAGFMVLFTWLDDVWERSDTVSMYLGPLLGGALMVAIWVGLWAFLSRVFLGQARAIPNVMVALCGVMAFFVAGFMQEWLGFALANRSITAYSFIANWVLLGLVCLAHLRLMRVRFFRRKAAIVFVLVFGACLTTWIEGNPFAPDKSSDVDKLYRTQMFPPSWRLTAPRTETEFIEEVRGLKTRLDELRQRTLDDKSESSSEDAGEDK
jgi:hypothetical protein